MQVKLSLLSLCMLGALCACSSEESGLASDKQQVFSGDEAYINVRLADAGALTKATDGGYEHGEHGANEHAVKSASFYFYDANGNYMAKGSVWNDGTDIGGNSNIEFKSSNIIALSGLKNQVYPKYMVTVLNEKKDFSSVSTLSDMEKTLSSESDEGIKNNIGGTECFTMSTTSYKHNDNTPYFVTEVTPDDFSTEPIPADISGIKAVNVYVERLAAKVTLGVDMTPVTLGSISDPDRKFYEIKANVVGIDGTDPAATGKLYVELLGWKLNATAKSSNIVKNINKDWTDSELGFTWNNPNDFRSFWGMSFNYSKTDGNPNSNSAYPNSAKDMYNSGGLTPHKYLSYVNLESPTLLDGSANYCAENTNTSGIVNAYSSAVTSVLLKAMVCDKDGNGLDLVRYNGVLFKQEQFLDYILNKMNTLSKLNVYVKTTGATGGDVYTQIDKTCVELVNVSDGVVKVQLKEPTGDLYEVTAIDATTGDKTFGLITDKTAINNDFGDASLGAIGYKGGLMYYNIPIEHLNATKNAEAAYGVVRNHHYAITVNKLENIGRGIWDPEEVIIPNNDDTYYIGATISILSWKLITHTVGL